MENALVTFCIEKISRAIKGFTLRPIAKEKNVFFYFN